MTRLQKILAWGGGIVVALLLAGIFFAAGRASAPAPAPVAAPVATPAAPPARVDVYVHRAPRAAGTAKAAPADTYTRVPGTARPDATRPDGRGGCTLSDGRSGFIRNGNCLVKTS